MNKLNWCGYSNKDRIAAIYELENIINQHGYIINYARFSDMAAAISIEIEERKINDLYEHLKNFMEMNEFELINSNSEKECLIYLNITFGHATGDLKIEVPHVPG